jgi:hypothetical protein
LSITNITDLVTATLPKSQIQRYFNATVPKPYLETFRGMRIQKTLTALCSILVVHCVALSAFAIEVTEPAAAAHGYPGVYDIKGKKLANSEFRQWVENNRLHVVITHKFSAGQVYEEQAQFRQQPELIQENGPGKNQKMESRSVNSLWIFRMESPAHTSARRIRRYPKRLMLNRDGRLRGLGSALL